MHTVQSIPDGVPVWGPVRPPELREKSVGKKRVEYRCVATSVEGFVQQVAVQYLRHGYWFYVAGRIPERKDPAVVDAKLIKKYGIDVSRWERARRKRAGLANIQYIRNERCFLLMATHGGHRYFDEETRRIRDARRVPIKFAGYGLSYRNGHACVRIERAEYLRLKEWFLDRACYRSAAVVGADFAAIEFQPYAPIRVQLLNVWRAVNRARRVAGNELVPVGNVPWKRRIVRVFE